METVVLCKDKSTNTPAIQRTRHSIIIDIITGVPSLIMLCFVFPRPSEALAQQAQPFTRFDRMNRAALEQWK